MRPPSAQITRYKPVCRACRAQHHLRLSRPSHPHSSRPYASSSSSSSSSTPPTSTRPLRLAIIGSGPSGFYTASRILSLLPLDDVTGKDVRIHMYERLPTPYGLVRYGVAPDHPEVKNCQHKFDALAEDPRFRFFGNVSVGSQPSASSSSSSSSSSTAPATALSSYAYPHALHLPLSALLPHYSAILFTYGASLSNPLSDVPGSSSSSSPLEGVYPALALVGWYNGHPAFSDLRPDLSTVRTVSVVGQGNVALDIARILLKPIQELEQTDIPSSVLEVLTQSKVESVSAVGRRGPAQVAFTTKEFREMLKLPGVRYGGLDKEQAAEAKETAQGDRARTRLLGLMEAGNRTEGQKEFKLEFLRSPKAFLAGRHGRVAQVEWTKNQLLSPPPSPPVPPASQAGSVPAPRGGGAVARPTRETVTTQADMVVESVGYRSEPLLADEGGWGMPFDANRGRVRNVDGRVVDEQGLVIPGLYTAGWAARGPVGVIASTMHDAYTLAESIIHDHLVQPSTSAPLQLPTLGQEEGDHPPEKVTAGLKEGTVVDIQGWTRIDQAERDHAKRAGKGKEREKFVTVGEMLSVLS